MNLKYRKIKNLACIHGVYLSFQLLSIFTSLPCQAEIYMQTSSSGMIQFSDQPTAPASPIILRKINSYSPSPTPTLTTVLVDNKSDLKTYEKVILQTPKEGQTFQNQQQIPVSIDINPALNPKDKIEIWLDENLYQRGNEAQITLQNVERGEHHLQIKVTNAEGKLLNATNIVTFFVHQTIGESPS
ncbi:MAG TPA: hypothetical protein VHE99_07730 [Gammaproteobacteria bacterium]|nr:hypothetical protein [Gammaproteobacteria bacterium]